jgi:hypothetical protein
VKVEATESTSHIVRLVPSTHMKPLGTIYFMLACGTWICIPCDLHFIHDLHKSDRLEILIVLC